MRAVGPWSSASWPTTSPSPLHAWVKFRGWQLAPSCCTSLYVPLPCSSFHCVHTFCGAGLTAVASWVSMYACQWLACDEVATAGSCRNEPLPVGTLECMMIFFLSFFGWREECNLGATCVMGVTNLTCCTAMRLITSGRSAYVGVSSSLCLQQNTTSACSESGGMLHALYARMPGVLPTVGASAGMQ